MPDVPAPPSAPAAPPTPAASPAQRAAAEDPASRDAVVADDEASRRRWAEALGTTDEALAAAIRAVGPRIDRIKEHLGQGGYAADQTGG